MVSYHFSLFFLVDRRGNHQFGSDDLVEELRGYVAELNSFFFQRFTLLVGALGYLCCLLVADNRVQSSDQHQGSLKIVLNYNFVYLDADQTVFDKGFAAVREELNRMDDISDYKWFVDIQLKMTVHTAHRNRHIVAHYLAT